MTAIVLTKTGAAADLCASTDVSRVVSGDKLYVLSKGRFKGYLLATSGRYSAMGAFRRALEAVGGQPQKTVPAMSIDKVCEESTAVMVSPKGDGYYIDGKNGEISSIPLPTFLGCDGPYAFAAHLGGASLPMAIDIAAGIGNATGKGKTCYIVKGGKWIKGI